MSIYCLLWYHIQVKELFKRLDISFCKIKQNTPPQFLDEKNTISICNSLHVYTQIICFLTKNLRTYTYQSVNYLWCFTLKHILLLSSMFLKPKVPCFLYWPASCVFFFFWSDSLSSMQRSLFFVRKMKINVKNFKCS